MATPRAKARSTTPKKAASARRSTEPVRFEGTLLEKASFCDVSLAAASFEDVSFEGARMNDISLRGAAINNADGRKLAR